MKFSIFYSWQSDLPNKTNRGFIESVIEKTIKDWDASDQYDLDPSLDRDTLGVPGAPNISEAILEKIRNCDAFVADVSIVTGNKEQGQRLSPNPNVLVELGYAVSQLGWNQIILFCNTVYGEDSDLPFDIRQQRCIHYELHEDDPKAAARKELASLLRVRIDEILENGLRNLKGSGPKLTTSWNYMDCTKDLQEGIAADCLELTRGDPIVNVSPEAMSEFLTMKTVTGSFDPNWGEKMTAYKADLDKFEKDMEDSEKRLNFSIMGNLGKVVCATVVVENIGNKPATEIRAKFEIPDWLHVFKELPDKSDTPQTPVPPEPSLPKYASAPKSFSQLGKVSGLSDHLGNLITQNINKSSGCYLRKSNIHFWAAQLLHKHEIYSSDDQIYFFVETDAPVGEYVVEGTIFCSEYDDWRDCELLIKIK